MNQNPLVSVIVPVYNMEQYLGETIESILKTDYHPFEVIIVDDGSKDNSFAVAQSYAKKDNRVKAFTQPNSGTCTTRNKAITLANGEYILPVDGDDMISADFISLAINEFKNNDKVKVVCPKAEFFGDRQGAWNLPPFSLNLLARKNIISACALFKKSDWESVGGYCAEIIYREDWDFWISMLKNGGEVIRLNTVTFYYRIRPNSKRIKGRKYKKHVIDTLNKRHKEFFLRELGGPLHYQRSWSKLINRILKFKRRFICQ